MSIFITNFEKQLLQKIQQKSTYKLSLDTFLFKNFKFFDLKQTGALTKADFFRAIAKCGVAVPSTNADEIFEYYSQGSQKISYSHFIEEFVGREEELVSNSSRLNISQKSNYDFLQNKSMSHSQVSQGKEEISPNKTRKMVVVNNYNDLLGYIKATLQQQGLGSLAGLAAKLKTSDVSKTHRISTMKLFSSLPYLTMDHLNILSDELSEGKDNIDYSLLVYDLKGEINEDISAEISSTFYFLDIKREGEILIDYLLSRFLNRSLEMKFKKAVDAYCVFQGINDGVFTEDDFNDFLGFLSFDYTSSDKFKAEIIRGFYEEDNKSTISQKSNRTRDFQGPKNMKGEGSQPIGDFKKEKAAGKRLQSEQIQEDDHFSKFKQDLDDKDEKKSVSRYSKYQGHELNNSRMSVFESVIQRIKKRLASKGTKGFLILQKSLKNADLNQDTLLSVEQFIQVIKDQRIDITFTECNSIFDLFDNQGTGLISFPEFMFTIRGQMPAFRRELVNKLWLQVKLNAEQTSLSKIKHSLNFRIHPDVQTGRRYEDDIWKQIQDTVFLIQQLNGRARGDTLLRGDFDEYMENLSLSVLDDRLFESILLNFWRLDNSLSILQKYAGSRKLFDQSKNGYLMDHHRNHVKGGSVSENAPFGTFKEATTYTTEHRRL